ncbi:MAG: iron ABC transporter permease [Desulfobacterales bacterium]|nr:iron ABC transporter permease [Desulfobacterales bacterium]
MICVFSIILGLIILVSSGLGYISIPPFKVANIILSSIIQGKQAAKDIHSVVILDVRLPRILTSAIVGAGLSLSGTVFQGILLNPLADPYTLGVSAGAAFGAAIGFLIPFSDPVYSVPVFAFLGALCSLFMVIYLSSSDAGLSSNHLILSGIIVTSILSAAISFLKYLANEQVSVIIFWLMGSFVSKTWFEVNLTWITLCIGFMIVFWYARDLNLISLGAKTAVTTGVNTQRVTLILLITASLITAICVSVSGIIGFIGLLVPHMTRWITGPDNRRLIPMSMLFGAILLLCADTITRTVLPHDIPIGVFTALIGGPVFCYIFRQQMTIKN